MLGPFGAKHITICHNKCQNDGAHTQHGASRKVNTSMSPSWTTLWWCSLKIRHLADWSRLSRAGKSSTRLGISQGRSSKGWFSQRFSVAMFDDTRGHVILELFVDCDSHKSGVPRQLEPTFRWSKIWPQTVPWDPTKMTLRGSDHRFDLYLICSISTSPFFVMISPRLMLMVDGQNSTIDFHGMLWMRVRTSYNIC